ncbi:MAG: glutamate racemase [Flavobacteriales bacterium]
MERTGKIGVFDSGFGGLTILRELVDTFPRYDFIYLGDNARAPYGNKSFDLIYEYTLEGVKYLFDQGCELVILACNTASAKALRTIQQKDLPRIAPSKRVLGVIRPSTEEIGTLSRTGVVGVLGTEGTVSSNSYGIELAKLSPTTKVIQQACPLWVPLIEQQAYDSAAGKLIIASDIKRLFDQNQQIDVIVLACTHYPILKSHIEALVPPGVMVLAQGPLVAEKLKDYLNRHPEIEQRLSLGASIAFNTTESSDYFNEHASVIFGKSLHAEHIQLNS